MGQKVHPKSIRLGISADWDSVWFAGSQSYADYLHHDFQVRSYLEKQLEMAALSRIVIQRTSKQMKVFVHSARPGSILGKKGGDVEALRRGIEAMVGITTSVNVVEIRRAELDAKLVSDNIARQLERRVPFRRVMKRSLQNTMRFGAEGIKIAVSGRLGGAEIARREWVREGRVPLQIFRANIDYGTALAKTTYGIIGVKVWIFKGEVNVPSNEENKVKKGSERIES